MKNNIIAILICIMAFILVKLCMGDFTIESDTYGYYKDGKLNERGLISIVRDTKRRLPIYTEDTVVFDINYTYSKDPYKSVINYFHNVNKDKVADFKNRADLVASNIAFKQCGQQEILDILDKMDGFTISFYDQKTFLYAIEINKEVCEKVLSDQGKEVQKPKTKTKEEINKIITSHVKVLNKNLPIAMDFGSLVEATANDQNIIAHIFEVNKEQVERFNKNKKDIKARIQAAYCQNAQMKDILELIPFLIVQYQSEGSVIEQLKVEKELCKNLKK